MFYWYQATDSSILKEAFPTFYESIYFNGNKVLAKDSAHDTAWFNAFAALCKAHFTFIDSRRSTILQWAGSE